MKTIFKYILWISIAILATVSVADAQRKKVGVVLSGGGAKGVAHITALRVLEEAGIPIDYIAGTSMGAIVGGLYAIGYDTQTLDSMVRSQNWIDLLSDKVPRRNLSFTAKEQREKYLLTVPLSKDKRFQLPSGIVGGHNVYNLLTELTIGYHDSLSFNSFPIPFACVAYDMVTGKAVTLDSGYLAQAIRASMSIPGAFQPINTDGMVLIDGGIANNFPTDVVKEMGAEIIIGVDVSAGGRGEEDLVNLSDMFNQITYIMGEEAFNNNMKLVDLYINPDIKPYTAGSFQADAIDTLLHRGEVAAYAKWEEIIALKEKIGIPGQNLATEHKPVELDRQILISSISFEGLEYQREKILRKMTGLKEGTEIRPSEIQEAVAKLQGMLTISEVNYKLEGNSPYNLVFYVKESTRNSISLGLRFDSEEMAAILLNVQLAAHHMSNSHFDITGRLSENPYIKGSYILGNETERRLTLSYKYKYNSLNLYEGKHKASNMDFNHHIINADFSNIHVRNFRVGMGMRYEYFHLRSALTLADARLSAELNPRSEGLISYYASAQLETLDRRYNPKKGCSFMLEGSFYTSNFANYHGDNPFGAVHVDFLAALSVSRRITFLPGFFGRVLIGDNVAFPAQNMVGGTVAGRYLDHQIPFVGVRHFQRFEKAVIGAKLDGRINIDRKNFVSVKSSYAKQDDDFFEIFNGRDIWGIGLAYSYSTIIGPIDFQIDYSNLTKKMSAYFNLGYYF